MYFTAQPADFDITEEFKYIKKLSRELRGPIKLSVCRVDKSSALPISVAPTPGKPELHFFPNTLQGDDKLKKSVRILFDKNDAKFA